MHISGVISTDPLSIINSQKQFYTKLYSSCKTKLDTPEATAFFENPNLPKLSNEASNECEGRITIDECQNIIKTFPLVHQNSQYSGHSIIYRFRKSIRQS